jgi:hypothetical protein
MHVGYISHCTFMSSFTFVFVLCFDQYPDGQTYLATYDFEHYQKQDFWIIAGIFIICNIVVFYFGLNSIHDNFYYFFCCKKVRYNVRDRYGNDCRLFEELVYSSESESIRVKGWLGQEGDSSSSSSGGGVMSHGAGSSCLKESLLISAGGKGKGRGRRRKRNQVYRGIDDDDDDEDDDDEDCDTRLRASSDLNKNDLSFIRTNSSLAPKIFARETSVSSQAGFKTQSGYSRGFSSVGNSGSGG